MDEFWNSRGRVQEHEGGELESINEVLNTRWTTPPEGWYKINTDAAYKFDRAAIGAVVLDGRGNLVFLVF